MKSYTSRWDLGKAARVLLILAMLVGVNGCTRRFYRKWADQEVNDILAEKDKFAFWKIEQAHVYPDKRARFADPTNPDRTLMPPDDEATYLMSPHPQRPGHAGVGRVEGTAYLEMIKEWDVISRAERKELEAAEDKASGGPSSSKHPILSYLDAPLNAKLPGYVLKLDQCIELGVINSREYQSFREQLYLSALPVTQERFNFSYQWAAIADFIREWAGPKSPNGFQNNWTGSSSLSVKKLFATGAMLTADFANTTVWNFAKPRGLTSSSTIDLNVVQPVLQGGGKAVTLEPLTEAERNLFYSIRAYARFRKQFNVAVALGTTLPNNLATAAGAATGTNPISTLAALGIASTDVAGGFVGYLSTLYRECDMAADQKLVFDLQRALKILEGYQEGGMFSPLQVDQVRSTLINAQNTVLTDKQFITNALDQFKLVLGIPANYPLILDDTPARAITLQLDHYYEMIAEADAVNRLIESQDQLAPEKLRDFLRQTFTKDPLVRNTEFQKKVAPSWDQWAATKDKELLDRLIKVGKERRDLFELKTDVELKGQEFSPENVRNLREAEFEYDLGSLEQQLRRYEARPWEKQAKAAQKKEQVAHSRLIVLLAKNVLVWARNERSDAVAKRWPKASSVTIGDLDVLTADVDQAQEAAIQVAHANRVDLMNARAQVVDAWRQLRVTANALLGVFNVQYHLLAETNPVGVRPLVFSTDRNSQQLTLDAQLPLNRLAQRNAYRTALINYQFARRSLIALEDNIAVQVRFDVRQLQLFEANYQNQQKVLKSLYSQVENALELIVAPADPDQLKSGGTAGAANAAALTSQYLTALNGLNNAQVKMYDIWLSLLATRMQLYLDLEQMPLDERGVWIEPSDSTPINPTGEVLRQIPPAAERPANAGNRDADPLPIVGTAPADLPLPPIVNISGTRPADVTPPRK